MCDNCGAIGRKLKTQKLLDCALIRVGVCAIIAIGRALIRVRVCAVITVLWVVN